MSERQRRVAAAGISVLILVLSAQLSLAADAVAAARPDTADAVHEDDQVVVTASRYGTDVHLSHTDVPASDIARENSATDVPMMLRDIPGVYSYSDAGNGIGYTYLKIRGFDQRRVGVLVNGIPLNDPEDHQVYWVNLPDLAASVDDVQVQRGITTGVSGVTAIGGTVNLEANVLDERESGRLVAETGSYGTDRRMIRYSTGELDGGFSTGLRLSQITSDGYRDRAGSDQWAVFWSGQWQNDAHRVRAHAFTGHEVTHHAWDPAPASILEENRRFNPETYWNAIDDFRQPQYQLHWDWALTDRLTLRNSAYVVHGEGFYESFRDGEDAFDYGLDALFPGRYASGDAVDLVTRKWVRKDQVGWVPSLIWEHQGGRMVLGGGWYTFHSNHWGDVMDAGPGAGGEALRPAAIPGGAKYYGYTGDRDAASLYLDERWEFLPGLTLLADLQFQHRQYEFEHQAVGNFTGEDRYAFDVDHDFFNPKGGLFWQTPLTVAGADLGVYGHVGVAHREPADSDYWPAWDNADDIGTSPVFNELDPVSANGEVQYVRAGDVAIDPERVVNWEGGVALRSQDLSLTLNGYYMDFEDEIVGVGYSQDDRGALRYNAGETVHKGLELGLRWRPEADHRLAVAASRSWNEYEDFAFVAYEGAEPLDVSGHAIPLFPEVLVSATWSAWIGPFSSDLRVRHTGKQYLDNTGDEARTIDAHTVVDLMLYADIGELVSPALDGARAYVRLFNLLDEEYETWGYYDAWDYGENMYTPGAERHVLAGMSYDF